MNRRGAATSDLNLDMLKPLKPTSTKETAHNDMVSDLSSLNDDEADFDLLNPVSRKFRNDKEFL